MPDPDLILETFKTYEFPQYWTGTSTGNGEYTMMTQLLGWSDAKYKKACPAPY